MAPALKSKADLVREFLTTPEGKQMTNAQVAKKLDVNDGTVSRVRQTLAAKEAPQVRTVKIADLDLDAVETQMRPKHDADREEEFGHLMASGVKFPPVKAVETEDGRLIPWDGWHRLGGAAWADLEEVEVEVTQGSEEDAVFLACGANADGTLPRCNETKRKSVLTLMEIWERRNPGTKPTNAWLAEHAKVHVSTVAKVLERRNAERRAEDPSYEPPTLTVTRDGAAVETARLDGSKAKKAKQRPAEDDDAEVGAAVPQPPAEAPVAKADPNADARAKAEEDEGFLQGLHRDKEKPSVRSLLKGDKRRGYEVAALRYKAIHESEAYKAAAALIRRTIEDRTVGASRDPFSSLMSAAISAPHPRDWVVCFACGGTGKHKDGDNCQAPGCKGSGFKMR